MLRERPSPRKAFSAIFVYVTTAGTVYMNKNRRNGGGRKISSSPVCWRLAGWNPTSRGQTRRKAADLWKSHAQGLHNKRVQWRFPLPLGLRRWSWRNKMSFVFIRLPWIQLNSLPLPRKHACHPSRPSGHPHCPQVQEKQPPSHSSLIKATRKRFSGQ